MQKKVGKYLLVSELGKGQFGSVYKGLDTEDTYKEYAVKHVARKKVESNPVITKLFKSEVQVMKQVKHPNLLNLHDFLETSSNYYVVVPFCKDGDLEKYLDRNDCISEPEAVFFLKQIMSGFLYLHQKKIMHRDFKLANIFLDGKRLVIGDFGFAKAGADVATTKLGTPYNMAPEIIFSTGKTPYTSKADLWSIGVVYFQMLYGRLPFKAVTMDELKKEIRNKSGDKLNFPSYAQISNESKQLLMELLEFDPISRMSWKKFFNHPLFEKFKEFAPAKSILQSQLNMQDSMHMKTPTPLPEVTPLNKIQAPNLILDQSQEDNLDQMVENNFKNQKKVVNENIEYSTNFELPGTLDIVDQSPNAPHPASSQSNITFSKSTARNTNDECNTFLTHERNKYLLVLQTSKRLKDLMKVTPLSEKVGHFMMLSLALCKRGLLMTEFLTRTLQNRADIFKLDGFNEFCGTSLAEKLKAAFQEDKKNSQQFMQYLEAKLNDPIVKNVDPKVVDQIRSPSANESFLDAASDKLLVHLLNWMKVAKSSFDSTTYRQFIIAMVYTHYTLHLSSEFPLKKQGSIFNWKEFFEGVDRLDDNGIAQIVYQYYGRKDEVDKKGCFLFNFKKVLC